MEDQEKRHADPLPEETETPQTPKKPQGALEDEDLKDLAGGEGMTIGRILPPI